MPEIALTPQIGRAIQKDASVNQLRSYIADFPKVKKYDEWRKIEREEAQVVVGARYCYFCSAEKYRIDHYR